MPTAGDTASISAPISEPKSGLKSGLKSGPISVPINTPRPIFGVLERPILHPRPRPRPGAANRSSQRLGGFALLTKGKVGRLKPGRPGGTLGGQRGRVHPSTTIYQGTRGRPSWLASRWPASPVTAFCWFSPKPKGGSLYSDQLL